MRESGICFSERLIHWLRKDIIEEELFIVPPREELYRYFRFTEEKEWGQDTPKGERIYNGIIDHWLVRIAIKKY